MYVDFQSLQGIESVMYTLLGMYDHSRRLEEINTVYTIIHILSGEKFSTTR